MELKWIDAKDLRIEGLGWQNNSCDGFGRLPVRAKPALRDVVWRLGKAPTGVTVRFCSDSPAIHARWELEYKLEPPSCNVNIAAHSGLDLYVRDESGAWRWAGNTPRIMAYPESKGAIIEDLEPRMRDYLLYLPLLNPVKKLSIGVDKNTTIKPAAKYTVKPIVVYGTSVVNGEGVSRPGMVYSSILARKLDMEFINLGFCGNALMEPAIADLLIELDCCLYILDAAPNMPAPLIQQRAEIFIRKIRAAKPDIPIILMEDKEYAASWLVAQKNYENRSRREALRQVYEKLHDDNITYVEGSLLLGNDAEATVDGSHPNDLGAFRMADYLLPIIKDIMRSKAII